MSGDRENASARYARQAALPVVGPEGQARLVASTVVIVGCGALGSVQAELAARAGVGRLIVADRDVLELHNLQRQLLFDEHDVAERAPKAIAAARRLRAINSQITVEEVVEPRQLLFSTATVISFHRRQGDDRPPRPGVGPISLAVRSLALAVSSAP